MKRTVEQVRTALFSLSLRFKEAGYTVDQLELLSREYHEDLGGITAEDFDVAIKEGRRDWRWFPKIPDIREYADRSAAGRVAIDRITREALTEGPTYKSDLDKQKSRDCLRVLGEVSAKVITVEEGNRKIAAIKRGE